MKQLLVILFFFVSSHAAFWDYATSKFDSLAVAMGKHGDNPYAIAAREQLATAAASIDNVAMAMCTKDKRIIAAAMAETRVVLEKKTFDAEKLSILAKNAGWSFLAEDIYECYMEYFAACAVFSYKSAGVQP